MRRGGQHEDLHALLERAARVLGDRSPRRAAEEPVVDVLPLAVVLRAVADRDREACEGRAALGAAELGVVGDVPTKATWFIIYLLRAAAALRRFLRRVKQDGDSDEINRRHSRSEHPWACRTHG